MITFNSTVAKWSGAYGNVKIAKLKIISSLSNVAVKQAVHGDVMHEMSVVMHLQGGHQCLPYVFGIIDEKTLIMELVSDESCSVNHHVQSNSFSTQQWLRICYEFADGLSYIHSKGILHNDLHANNLLISKEHMTAKIIDFGSATLKSCPRK